VRGRIESIIDWGDGARLSQRAKTPAPVGRGHLENPRASAKKVSRVRHLAALPYNQIGRLYGRAAIFRRAWRRRAFGVRDPDGNQNGRGHRRSMV